MNEESHITTNKEWWEKMVAEECGFTQPWLTLDTVVLEKLAAGELTDPPEPLNDIYPLSVLADVQGKDVLCLASGGGQQSAVFSLLGGNVTVVDIAKGQLEGDKQAASHYGYQVRTVQGDMSDLSDLEDNSFDLVYQAPSMCYVPDVNQVYSGVQRVLRRDGLYRADALNPLTQYVDESSWDGQGYRIAVPYAVKEKQRSESENVVEYRHYLSDAFNGLIQCGFRIEHVEEMPKSLYQSREDQPGSWGHLLRYIPGLFAILAKRI